jgi:NifU-like protein involved in Fe-S cluster formation
MKNNLLKKHFLHPKNIGTIENTKYKSIAKSDTCNDIVKISALINQDGIFDDIKIQVYGCGYSISGASLLSEIAIGKNISEIDDFVRNYIETNLDDLTEKNKSCVLLAKNALLDIANKFESGI